MGVFERTIHRFADPWWLNRYGRKFIESYGATLDIFADRVFEGRRAAIPYAASSRTDDGVPRQCDAEVLPHHAYDRGIRLYDTEPELSKRIRLAQWRSLKKRRGSHRGELENIRPYFLRDPQTVPIPRMRIVHQSNGAIPEATWHTLDPDGTYSVHKASPSNWDFDGVTTKRSRFWLIVYTEGLFDPPPVWDGGERWDGGQVWDGVFTWTQTLDFVSMVQEAKAAHSELWGIIYATDPASFDPTSTAVVSPEGWTSLPVGNWGTIIDNDTGQPTRLPTAVFAYDLGQG